MQIKIMKNQSYELSVTVDDESYSFIIPKLETSFISLEDFSVLNIYSRYNQHASFYEDEDNYIIKFVDDESLISFSEIVKIPYVDKLRLCLNLCNLETLLSRQLVPFIHPDNIQFDVNYMPFLRYRGMLKKLEPKEYSDEQFLLELKCYILSILNKELEYEDLVRSGMKLKKFSGLEKEIINVISTDDMRNLLYKLYEEERIKIASEMELVSIKGQKRNKVYKIASSSLLVLLTGILIWTTFFVLPYKNDQLNANAYYLASDYNKVTEILDKYSINKLSSSSKYILASSSISTSSLTSKQKEVLLSELSISSYDVNLNYWIHYGRGEFEKAHEDALALQDVELKYFATISYLDYLSSETKMKASDKQAKIQEYEGYKSSYENELKSIEDASKEQKTDKGGK